MILTKVFSGERGIRTPGPSQVNGFQDRRNRPLCHLSVGKSKQILDTSKNNPAFYLFRLTLQNSDYSDFPCKFSRLELYL